MEKNKKKKTKCGVYLVALELLYVGPRWTGCHGWFVLPNGALVGPT